MLLFEAILAAVSWLWPSPMGDCDPRDGDRLIWSAEARAETRARVAAACRAVGASEYACAYADVVTVRESSGRAGIRHQLAPGEDGLGAHGLSLRWHWDKWPGDADPDWCQPEASFAVLHALMWRAVDHWGAQDVVEVQAVFGGHWRTMEHEGRKRTVLVDLPNERRFCARMRRRGFDCGRTITTQDLGARIPLSARKTWADDQAAAFDG